MRAAFSLKDLVIALALGAAIGCGEARAVPDGDAGKADAGKADAGKADAGKAGAGGASSAPAAWPKSVSSCEDKPGALRGKSYRKLTAAKLERTFIYYAPSTLDPNKPAPVVIVAHGFNMTADMMFDVTRYSDIADREGLILLFPNGQTSASITQGPWTVGTPDCRTSSGFLPLGRGDDQAFVNEMLRFAESDQCVDAEHVYMTGFYMGGYLSNETGCVRPEIRAVVPHSGGTHDLSACASEHKPVLIMHFEEDELIPYACALQARDRWVAKNGCQLDDPEVQQVSGGRCEYYRGCAQEGQVGLCSFTTPPNGTESYVGHGWSGGSELGKGAGFAITQTESASELSIRFFKQYAW